MEQEHPSQSGGSEQVAEVQEPSTGHAARLRAHQVRAQAAVQRLIEHFPVNTDHKRPTDHQSLMDYIEWAVPRARKLGTHVTRPEARSIGFMHALFTGIEAERAERLAAQKKEEAEKATALEAAGGEPEKATLEWLCKPCAEPVFGTRAEEHCIGGIEHMCFVCGERKPRAELYYRPVTGAQTIEMQSHRRG